jgi:hypothetical protein
MMFLITKLLRFPPEIIDNVDFYTVSTVGHQNILFLLRAQIEF